MEKVVLHWERPSTWVENLREIVSEIFCERVFSAFENENIEYFGGDETSWLDNIVRHEKLTDVNAKQLVANRISEGYTHFRAFHACRPAEPDSYMRLGVIPLSHSRARIILNKYVDEIGGGIVDRLDLDDIICSEEKIEPEGRIFFHGSEKFLKTFCSSYFEYGSEYISGVMNTICGKAGVDYREFMSGVGVPRILACDVPFKDLDWQTKLYLSGSIIEYIFMKLKNVEYDISKKDISFYIESKLKPENIVTMYDPYV